LPYRARYGCGKLCHGAVFTVSSTSSGDTTTASVVSAVTSAPKTGQGNLPLAAFCGMLAAVLTGLATRKKAVK